MQVKTTHLVLGRRKARNVVHYLELALQFRFDLNGRFHSSTSARLATWQQPTVPGDEKNRADGCNTLYSIVYLSMPLSEIGPVSPTSVKSSLKVSAYFSLSVGFQPPTLLSIFSTSKKIAAPRIRFAQTKVLSGHWNIYSAANTFDAPKQSPL
jgi:hypothetical protein